MRWLRTQVKRRHKGIEAEAEIPHKKIKIPMGFKFIVEGIKKR
jgi:hypothetical protein